MIAKISLYSIALMIVLLVGCDPGSAYYYSINNKSNEPVTVCFSYKDEDKIQCRTVPEGDSVVFDSVFLNIKGRDYGDNFLKEFYDTVNIKAGNKILQKDIYNRNSWSFSSSERGKVGMIDSKINNYSITIEDKSFQK